MQDVGWMIQDMHAEKNKMVRNALHAVSHVYVRISFMSCLFSISLFYSLSLLMFLSFSLSFTLPLVLFIVRLVFHFLDFPGFVFCFIFRLSNSVRLVRDWPRSHSVVILMKMIGR